MLTSEPDVLPPSSCKACNSDAVAVYGQNPVALLGVAHVYSGELIPDRLLSPAEVEQTLVQAWGMQQAGEPGHGHAAQPTGQDAPATGR